MVFGEGFFFEILGSLKDGEVWEETQCFLDIYCMLGFVVDTFIFMLLFNFYNLVKEIFYREDNLRFKVICLRLYKG